MNKAEQKDISQCTLCGMCRVDCPIFKVTKSEANSPRGKAILLKKGFENEIFYACTLCGLCKISCPIRVDLGLKDHRKKLVSDKIETPANRKMIANIKKFGNPFGDIKDKKKQEDLYCC